jgi:hypothetical protein
LSSPTPLFLSLHSLALKAYSKPIEGEVIEPQLGIREKG